MSHSKFLEDLLNGNETDTGALLQASASGAGDSRSDTDLARPGTSGEATHSRSDQYLCVEDDKASRKVIISDSDNFSVVVSGAWESCTSHVSPSCSNTDKDAVSNMAIVPSRRHSLPDGRVFQSNGKTVLHKELAKKLTSQKITDYMGENSRKRRRTSDGEVPLDPGQNGQNNATAMGQTEGSQANPNKPAAEAANKSTAEASVNTGTLSFQEPSCSYSMGNYKISASKEKVKLVTLGTQTPSSKREWNNLENCIDTFPSSCFQCEDDQDAQAVLPMAREFWRDTRASFDSHMRTDLRASQIQMFREEQLYPSWAFGWGPLPRYINKVPSELIQLRQEQASQMMSAMEDFLRAEAKNAKIKALAYQKLVRDVYKDYNKSGKYDLEEAEAKTRELLCRDLKKYTRDTQEHTMQQRGLPKITATEIGRITLKGPQNFGPLLGHFTKEVRKDENGGKNRSGPYNKGKPKRGGKNY